MQVMKLILGSEFSSSDPTYNPNVARVGPGDRVIVNVVGGVILSNTAQAGAIIKSFTAGVWLPTNMLDFIAIYPHTQTNDWTLDNHYDTSTGVLSITGTAPTNLPGWAGAVLCSIECRVKLNTTGFGGVISLFDSKLNNIPVPAASAEFSVEEALYRVAFADVTVPVGSTAKIQMKISPVTPGTPPPKQVHPYYKFYPKWDLNNAIAKITGGRISMAVPPEYMPPLRDSFYPNVYVVTFKQSKSPGVYDPLPPLTLPYGSLIELDVLGLKRGKTPLNMLNAGISAFPHKIDALYGDGMIEVV